MIRPSPLTTAKRTIARRVAELTPDAARSILDEHVRRGAAIGDDAYRALTGGYSSQTLDQLVTRALARRAGLVK